MNEVYADAFYWLARINIDDTSHRKAVELSKRIRGRIVTSQAVLIEVMDALCRPSYRALAYRFWRAVHDDGGVIIVEFEAAMIERAAEMFRTRPDKAWSMTDCLSFAIMSDRGITEALTGDQHFRQAGFLNLF